ncbi:MAG: hypothetical protein LHV68_05445 [Elusimicrobia bacterium]|nr:hypothetical protein [Candidatus Liberimonas magnetica]
MEKEKPAEQDYLDFIECLNKHKVDYLIIGAYAVIKHTKISRYTKDIDFWIRDTIENAAKTTQAIKDFIGIEENPRALLVKDEIYYIGIEPRRIDIFCNQKDLSFEDAFKRKVKGDFLGCAVSYISIDDAIFLKKIYKDKGNEDKYGKDIKRLEAVNKKNR